MPYTQCAVKILSRTVVARAFVVVMQEIVSEINYLYC